MSRTRISLAEGLSLAISNHFGQLTTACDSNSRGSGALFQTPWAP